jgi:hypothetical protein
MSKDTKTEYHIPVPKKTFELRPVHELLAIVRNDFRKLDDEGMIDEGRLIKTVMACNDRLGIPIREIKQKCIQVVDFKAKLPLNFEKLYFVAATRSSNTMVVDGRNPFDNKFDSDVIYEAELDRGSLGNTDSYSVTILRNTQTTVHNISTLTALDVHPSSHGLCHISCPNIRKKGKYTVTIEDDHINTPFRAGELYIMYLGTMEDEEGNILFPFHPLITPYYEWSVKEKVLMDCIFNQDGNYGELYKLAQSERVKAWLDAFNITTEKGYGEYVDLQRKKELGWYNQYFKFFQ